MQISVEKLNQIIEEEVIRFKRLNEQLSPDKQKPINELTKSECLAIITKRINEFDEGRLRSLISSLGTGSGV